MAPSARVLALVLAALLAGSGGDAVAAEKHLGIQLEYHADRLSGRIEGATPRDVLDAVAVATGAEVRGTPIEQRPVSIELDAVPLDDALHRLLGSQNFTLSYGRDGQPKALVLLGGPEKAPAASDRPTAAGVAVAPTGPTGPAFPLALSRVLMKARPVPVPEPLAEALGTDRATVPELLEMATTDEDGVRRAQATQAVLSAFERQSRLRRSFLRTLHDLDAPGLEAIVSGENGTRFVSVIEYLAAHSREQALQKKASVILEQLQPGGASPPPL